MSDCKVVVAEVVLNTLAPEVNTDQVPVPGVCTIAPMVVDNAQTV